MSNVTRQFEYILVLAVCLLPPCYADGEDASDKSPIGGGARGDSALLIPFVDEGDDMPGTVTGFPDPFPFKWGDDYYVCQSVVDLRNGRIYRTKTFEPDDMKKFPIAFDFGDVEGVWQVWGFKPYIHTDGSYHAYGSVHYGNYHTEVVHFVPQAGQLWNKEHPIQEWRLSRILVGKEETGKRFCYDGLAIRDEDGALYLVINEHIGKNNYITAWRMLDPDTIDPSFPRRIILGPDDYRSEDLPWELRLTEGTFIRKIQGKYVLIYSVGFFSDSSYKVGAAFCDTLIPPDGKKYKKVLIPDPDNVWGNIGEDGMEVKYLLQSQLENWPNYAGKFVDGPGIGSIVESEDGYWLIFAARRAGVKDANGEYRYPWKVPIKVNISDDRPMETWIETVLPK